MTYRLISLRPNDVLARNPLSSICRVSGGQVTDKMQSPGRWAPV